MIHITYLWHWCILHRTWWVLVWGTQRDPLTLHWTGFCYPACTHDDVYPNVDLFLCLCTEVLWDTTKVIPWGDVRDNVHCRDSIQRIIVNKFKIYPTWKGQIKMLKCRITLWLINTECLLVYCWDVQMSCSLFYLLICTGKNTSYLLEVFSHLIVELIE